MLKVGFLGPEGTFSGKAACQWLTKIKCNNYSLLPEDNISQLFKDLMAGQLQTIIVPVENSTEGAVNATLDLLVSMPDLVVMGEVSLSIEHCLLVAQPLNMEEILTVYSHPQALAQCYHYIQEQLKNASFQQTSSTAEAAGIVSQRKGRIAAISSREAARKYNLIIMARGIQDHQGNKTKFWILTKKEILEGCSIEIPGDFYKTSIIAALPYNKPGGLYEVLQEFARARIDLTRIESRPTKKELGEYLFFIDFVGKLTEPAVVRVLDKLEQKTVMLKILGSYPVYI
ncbi:MAG TPA: prephenate dehydratase [Clostridia bacterium]|nr:prephenate dehydratase [Clostridia bacterium]